jgi:hypothetical protein
MRCQRGFGREKYTNVLHDMCSTQLGLGGPRIRRFIWI